VRPGHVIGIDAADDVIAEATKAAGPIGNLEFRVGSVYDLAFDDASFDVVHAHQVLQHLTDPVAALREMRRVLRAGGVLAVRDSDYGAFTWAPADPLLDRWLELYHQVTARNGADADAGRHLLGWVRQAGFTTTHATTNSWVFDDPDARAWWGGLWADRCELTTFAEQAVAYGFSDPVELATIATAWRGWAARPDGRFAVPHCEVIAQG
jgi:SAM-dependent methyltransferase